MTIVPGRNDNLLAEALWDPWTSSGRAGLDQGRELLSQYISGTLQALIFLSQPGLTRFVGFNTTLTLKTHNGTIPSQPSLGKALSLFEIEIPTPRLQPPKNPNHPDGDNGDDRDANAPHFIDDATVVPALIDLITSLQLFELPKQKDASFWSVIHHQAPPSLLSLASPRCHSIQHTRLWLTSVWYHRCIS